MNGQSDDSDNTGQPPPSNQPDWPITDEAVRDVFARLIADGSWGRYHGPHCDALRTALVEYHQVPHATLCSSGTSAMELALRAAGVQAGDEVILAAYDYKANFVNVLTLGAIPVLVDTLPAVPVLDSGQLGAAFSSRTRAIICSHLHGSLSNLTSIKRIAADHEVPVIEDACQASGALLDGQRAGSIGDLGILSFGGSKLLTAGRGGAVLTGNATYAQRIRLYTQRGNDAYPLSEMQAAVLLPQLQQLDERNAIRLASVRRLQKLLRNHSARLVPDGLQLKLAVDPDPQTTTDVPAFYKLALRLDGNVTAEIRDQFSAAMRARGLPLDPGFPGLHQTHSRRRFRSIGNLPQATALQTCLLKLHHPILLAADVEIQLASALGISLPEDLSQPTSNLTR